MLHSRDISVHSSLPFLSRNVAGTPFFLLIMTFPVNTFPKERNEKVIRMKENVRFSHFWVLFLKKIWLFYCHLTGWLYSPVRMRNTSWKKSHNFRRLLLSLVWLMWLCFRKIETKVFNSNSIFFNLVKLGTISPAAHCLNCVHILRGQTMAATTCRISKQKFSSEDF